MTLVLSRVAERDLADIYDYIARDNTGAAQDVIDHLKSVMLQLDRGELSGPEARLRGGIQVRRWSTPPYRVYYRRSRTHVYRPRLSPGAAAH